MKRPPPRPGGTRDAKQNEEPLPRGEVLAGRYKTDRMLAEGTYARVYKAVDMETGRNVALKVERVVQKGTRALLKSESQTLRFLQNKPGIPRWYDFVRNDPTVRTDFLALQLLEEDIAAALNRVKRFSPAAAAHLGLQMLGSIEVIHENGLLHRDIKPNNFVLRGVDEANVEVYVVDFGLAKRHLDHLGEPRPPRPNAEFRGTTRYASVAAHRLEDLGRRDDLWSMLFSLLEMTIGYLPWSFYKGGRGQRLPPEERQAQKK